MPATMEVAMTNLRLRTWAAVGCALFLCSLAAAQPPAAPAIPQAAAPVPCDPWVEIVRSIAWPLSALIMALVFRRAIGAFVSALGTRVTKLSLFKVELELVPASSATSTPLLDDIRTVTTSAQINDSSRMMLEQVQAGGPADYAKIALGKGDEWLTSRLFIGAAMLERMRNLQVMVFVESRSTTDERFLAVVPVQTVRWALAQRYPHLEAAWVHAYTGLFPADVQKMPRVPPIIKSNSGAMDSWAARQLVTRFIDSLQRPAPPARAARARKAPPQPDWTLLHTSTVEERAEWVTPELLRAILPGDSFEAWTDEFLDAPRAKRTRAVLRRVAPFVATTKGDREFSRLINRRVFLEEIVAPLADEPEAPQ
jgi:hypothetical protein